MINTWQLSAILFFVALAPGLIFAIVNYILVKKNDKRIWREFDFNDLKNRVTMLEAEVKYLVRLSVDEGKNDCLPKSKKSNKKRK